MSYARNLFFYLIVGTPAYILIFYGLKGLGYIQYGYYTSPPMYNPYGTQSIDLGSYLVNYQPTPSIAPFFLIIGAGILTGLILRAIAKYSSEDLGMFSMLNVKSDFHETHCERTAFLVYAGIGAIAAALVIIIYFNALFGQNLLMLFVISMSSGVGALMWYRYEHEKFPFGR